MVQVFKGEAKGEGGETTFLLYHYVYGIVTLVKPQTRLRITSHCTVVESYVLLSSILTVKV